MTAAKERNKMVMELAGQFLEAVMRRQDWHRYSQLRMRKMTGAPNMPAFSDFKVIQTRNPGRGLDADVCRAVIFEITMGGNERIRLQSVRAKMLAILECDWEPCPDCNGEGQIGDEEEDGAAACSRCSGTGKVKVDPPRRPEKGSDTYKHDMANGVWGICPTSFEFIAGTQKALT